VIRLSDKYILEPIVCPICGGFNESGLCFCNQLGFYKIIGKVSDTSFRNLDEKIVYNEDILFTDNGGKHVRGNLNCPACYDMQKPKSCGCGGVRHYERTSPKQHFMSMSNLCDKCGEEQC
jgi:hypothetical protein